jgi:hypothetical protein
MFRRLADHSEFSGNDLVLSLGMHEQRSSAAGVQRARI